MSDNGELDQEPNKATEVCSYVKFNSSKKNARATKDLFVFLLF